MTHLGIVVGMAHEARCLAPLAAAPPPGHRIDIRIAGGSPRRARRLADALVADGARALLSFGVAGGLDPALRPGRLVVASAVVHPGAPTVQPTDPRWRAAVRAALPDAAEGPVLGSQRPLATPGDKAFQHDMTGAVAVDMESHSVAAAAGAAGLPFLAVRAIADPAGRAVPLAALAGLGDAGETRLWAVLVVLAIRPWQAPALVRLGADHRKAMTALAGAAGPALVPPAEAGRAGSASAP